MSIAKGPRKFVPKFARTNKATIKSKIGHTRTGACTAKGKCYHGWKK